MRVEALVPDEAIQPPQPAADAHAFGAALQSIGDVMARANAAEDAFAAGHGPLGAAIYERAQADVILSIATGAAQRTAQALQSVLNMQV